jgi:hypothetical protein
VGVAGVIGAAAAVYPLVFTNQQYLHLTVRPGGVRIQPLSDPVILTGNWYVKKRWAWFASDGDVTFENSVKGRRVTADMNVYFLEPKTTGVNGCADEDGDFELWVEFASKSGTGWASTRLPYCRNRWLSWKGIADWSANKLGDFIDGLQGDRPVATKTPGPVLTPEEEVERARKEFYERPR